MISLNRLSKATNNSFDESYKWLARRISRGEGERSGLEDDLEMFVGQRNSIVENEREDGESLDESQNRTHSSSIAYRQIVEHVAEAHLAWLEICRIGLLDRVVVLDAIGTHPLPRE
jgi:hypothetical protein